jgi:hypothetical protein
VINLWGNSANSYTLVGTSDQLGNPYGSSRQYGQVGGNATISVAPVPEPTTMVAGVGAIGFVLAGMARSRRSSVARMGK